jgi:predicted GTPase
MGYSPEQVKDLETTINQTDCDSVIIGTPFDLNRLIRINKPTTRVFYDLEEIGEPKLADIMDAFLKRMDFPV